MTKAITIILAERNRHIRELLARELAEEGYTVASCGLGKDAVALALGQADALVLDADLPDIAAQIVVGRVRQVRPGLPIVVHAHQADEAALCLAHDRVTVVAKGADPARLKQALRQALAGGEQAGAGREAQA
jgi:CheY-like chemotaxis protein